MSAPGRRGLPSFSLRVAAVGAAALAVRLTFVLLAAPVDDFSVDSIWYMLVGGSVAEGRGYISPGAFLDRGAHIATAAWPPGYPVLLAGISKLHTGTPTTFQVAGALLGAATAVLVGLVARRLAGDRAALIAVAVAAVHPLLLAVDGAVMSETLYLPLTVLALLAALAAVASPTRWRFLALGAALGAATLTRVDGLVLAPLLVGGTVLAMNAPWRLRAARGLLALAVVAAVLLPWVVRNERAIGQPVLSTNNGPTWAGANCRTTYYTRKIGQWAIACVAPQGDMTEARWSNRNQRQGINYARRHLPRAVLVVGVRQLRVFGLWDPIEQVRRESIESRRFGVVLAGWATYLVLLALAVPAAVSLARRRSPLLLPLAAVVLSVAVTAALTHGDQRFRLAAEPVVIALAAATLARLPRRASR